MNLSTWLENNSCDDEQREKISVELANLLPQINSANLNPLCINIDENNLTLTYNGADEKIRAYFSPEFFKMETENFSSKVFSFGLIIDELLRGENYFQAKGWSESDIQENISDEWFTPCEGDPLSEILTACLATNPEERPQSLDELKKILQADAEDFSESSKKDEFDDSQPIGIDLGTSNSTVAYFKGGKIRFLEIHNKKIIPSAILFKEMDADKWIYGEQALKRGILYPEALFKHFKRYIGINEPQIFHCEPTGDSQNICKYIIDTNIFLEDPFILDGITPPDQAIIPKTVYEELTRRKSVPETADKATAALNEIDKNIHRVILEDSHLDLIPEDMFATADQNNNSRNDTKVISVARHHDSPKTFLLSNDKGIAQKCTWFKTPPKFKVKNYREYSFDKNVADDKDDETIRLTGREGAVIFLKYLRREFQKKVGITNRAVITVPQKFSPIQRNEIKQAGLDAGFSEIELRTEPVAAAVAYGIDQKIDKNILVYDFGGGTFDVTILRISNGEFEVLSSGGDPKLGGEDFTQALVGEFKERLQSGEILSNDREFDMFDEAQSGLTHEEFMQNELEIWTACENIKCELSDSDEVTRELKLYVDSGAPREIVEFTLTREEFEDITADLVAKAKRALVSTIKQAGLLVKDIDEIIMAGGTSTIPTIKDAVKGFFGKQPYSARNPATLIAEGAAIFADIIWNQNSTIDKRIKIFERTVTDFGVGLKGNKFSSIIPFSQSLPVESSKNYSLVQDGQQQLKIECYTREPDSESTSTTDDSINYIGDIRIKNLPPGLKVADTDVNVIFRITKEYELEVEVRLKDKIGGEIKQTSTKIDMTGV